MGKGKTSHSLFSGEEEFVCIVGNKGGGGKRRPENFLAKGEKKKGFVFHDNGCNLLVGGLAQLSPRENTFIQEERKPSDFPRDEEGKKRTERTSIDMATPSVRLDF